MSLNNSCQLGKTREDMSLVVACCFGKGLYFARKVITWEITWKKDRIIEEGRKGCVSKISSWFNDEGVQLAVWEYLAGAGESITGHGLAQAIGKYLDSKRAIEALSSTLDSNNLSNNQQSTKSLYIQARTG